MLLVVDIGNTNIKLGVYHDEELIANFRIMTKQPRTSDEFGLLIISLLNTVKIYPKDIKGVIISSVVPDIMHSFVGGIKKFLHQDPMIIGPGIKTGIDIRTESPKEVGADRIINVAGAYYSYGGPALVVGFGTATIYDVVNADASFVAAITSPGIKISANALWSMAAQLPEIEIKKPPSILAKNTITSMQAGLVYGYIGQVEYIVSKIKEEIGYDMKVIATGGLGRIIFDETDVLDVYDRQLPFKGLKYIYDKNQ